MATMDFDADLDAFAKQVGIDYAKLVKRVAFDLFTRIVRKTPVDTGRARASWNISIGAPDVTVAAEGQHPGMNTWTGEAKANQALATLTERNALTHAIYITNNLPYIKTLEHGEYPKTVKFGTRLSKKRLKKGNPVKFEVRSMNGFSIQAPNGMVALSIEEVHLHLSLLTKIP